MAESRRFAVALHILTLLAMSRDAPATSETIAASVNTNPVVIRRLMGALRRAGLVTSQAGAGGGWRLVGCPAAMTLRDVYRAVEVEQVFATNPRSAQSACPVGRNIGRALAPFFQRAEARMEEGLAEATVADVLRATMPQLTEA